MATVREEVRTRYKEAAAGSSCCGGTSASSCCSSSSSTEFGYSIEELKVLPEGADLGLGCGNPTAVAGISSGETVVDLGSGGGIDCFLSAARVGDEGRVIGVDMTAEMIELARRNAARAGADNVEFRLGEIEHLPIADDTADLIISNCVINLSPDKPQVFREALRVLAPGGRLMVSDLVLESELREDLRGNMRLLTGCIAGALLKSEFLSGLTDAGFVNVRIDSETEYLKGDHLAGLADEAGVSADDAREIASVLRSANIYAEKPAS